MVKFQELAGLLARSALGHEAAAVLVFSATISDIGTAQRIDRALLGALGIPEDIDVLLTAAAARCSMIVVLHIELDSTKFDDISATKFVVLKREFKS